MKRATITSVVPLDRPLDLWTLYRYEEDGHDIVAAGITPVVGMATTSDGEVEYLVHDDDHRQPVTLVEYEERVRNQVVVGVVPAGTWPATEELAEAKALLVHLLTDRRNRSAA